jgi:hypothetical protein
MIINKEKEYRNLHATYPPTVQQYLSSDTIFNQLAQHSSSTNIKNSRRKTMNAKEKESTHNGLAFYLSFYLISVSS